MSDEAAVLTATLSPCRPVASVWSVLSGPGWYALDGPASWSSAEGLVVESLVRSCPRTRMLSPYKSSGPVLVPSSAFLDMLRASSLVAGASKVLRLSARHRFQSDTLSGRDASAKAPPAMCVVPCLLAWSLLCAVPCVWEASFGAKHPCAQMQAQTAGFTPSCCCLAVKHLGAKQGHDGLWLTSVWWLSRAKNSPSTAGGHPSAMEAGAARSPYS